MRKRKGQTPAAPKHINKNFAEQVARSAERSDASNFGRSDQVCSGVTSETLDFELVRYLRLEPVGSSSLDYFRVLIF